ncbi:hypothetical protein [Pseudomonas fluorescens]|nr:hypothetical protein [Pseudomonas fluorescens]
MTDHKNNYSTEVTKMSAASLYPVHPEVAANTLTEYRSLINAQKKSATQ